VAWNLRLLMKLTLWVHYADEKKMNNVVVTFLFVSSAQTSSCNIQIKLICTQKRGTRNLKMSAKKIDVNEGFLLNWEFTRTRRGEKGLWENFDGFVVDEIQIKPTFSIILACSKILIKYLKNANQRLGSESSRLKLSRNKRAKFIVRNVLKSMTQSTNSSLGAHFLIFFMLTEAYEHMTRK
jgi:hypothetical protein